MQTQKSRRSSPVFFRQPFSAKLRPIAGDFITRPSKKQRPAAAQAQVDQAAKSLTLYQFHACPFCVKTRRNLRRLNVPVTLRDAKNNAQDRNTLSKAAK